MMVNGVIFIKQNINQKNSKSYHYYIGTVTEVNKI